MGGGHHLSKNQKFRDFDSRRRSFAVSAWWHGTQSVRRLSRPSPPPPSTTGTMWSISHRCGMWAVWENATLRPIHSERRSAPLLSRGTFCSPQVLIHRTWKIRFILSVSTPQDAHTPLSRRQVMWRATVVLARTSHCAMHSPEHHVRRELITGLPHHVH